MICSSRWRVPFIAVLPSWVWRTHILDGPVFGGWVTLDTAWLITGAIAFAAVRNGNIESHRQWITRNYALTTIFVTVRVLKAFPIPDSYGEGPAWILLLATLLFTEVGLSWRGVFTKRRSQAPTMTRSAPPKVALAEVDN